MRSRSIEIHYIGKTEMDRLRRRFALDHDPSILSFSGGGNFPSISSGEKPLGEICLCAYYISKEARKRRMSVRDYEALLIAHGVLHLMGYDHVRDKDARRMESIEKSIFTKIKSKRRIKK
jgi:probable rRNA maturation factor